MLELYEYDALKSTDPDNSGMLAVLGEAVNVRISKEINAYDRLTFNFPRILEKAELITVNRLVKCEGQLYRVMKVSRGENELSAECLHIWYADSPALHIPTVPDSIGVTPYSLVCSLAAGVGGFYVMNERETSALGMHWIGMGDLLKNTSNQTGAEFSIDFFAVDKTSLFDFIKTVIDNAGFGEIYYDNKKFAIVEKIGGETGARLSLSSNLENISTEIDISSMITRLYPYGYEDMTIGSVYGKNYIDSPNAAIYGLKSGYKDYSDYNNVNSLFYNAKWEFDPENPDRIDVPSVSVTASAADLSRIAGGGFDSISLGDGVTVIDSEGTEIRERITALSYAPYEPVAAEVTIGRIKRDLYFYMSQISNMARRYSKCSTTSGMISARSISGTRASSSVQISSQSSTIKGDEVITVISENGTMVKIGIVNGSYMFKVYDNSGRLAVNTDSSQKGMVFAGARLDVPVIKLEYNGGEHTISSDSAGVYIDGKRIVTENV